MAKYDFRIVNSAYKNVIGQVEDYDTDEIGSIKVLKNEKFGVQVLIRSDEEFTLIKGNNRDICWKGLGDSIRISITAVHEGNYVMSMVDMYLMEFIQDDEGNFIADVLTENNSVFADKGYGGIFIEGMISADFPRNEIDLIITARYTRDYNDESIVFTDTLKIEVMDYVLGEISESGFYMDLWQHPCNWARAHGAAYYSEEHFRVIDRYFEGLSQLGQRVCDLIISDYPWAGQRCYRVEENHNNLFELNMVEVFKGLEGELVCDFAKLDQYIKLAEKHKIAEEINLFGILGNWDAYDFGNPLVDFKDPIRVSYYDLKYDKYKYLKSKEELKEYLTLVFNHIDELGLWDKTLIMSDEPSNVEVFKESLELFEEAAKGKSINLKCAIHDQIFFDSFGDNIKSLSLNTCELVHNADRISEIKENIAQKGGSFTWFSCCFPTQMNIFLKSPWIESRLIGWFTYYMELDGFLRWAYGVWPGDVHRSASYKPEKWAAGDMYLVYPSAKGAPGSSIRLKNLVYGIQDFVFFKEIEGKYGRKALADKMEVLLGKKDEMQFLGEREIALSHSLRYDDYMRVKEEMIEYVTQK